MREKTNEIDMTTGPLIPKILAFSIPLMLSGILQLLFNAADIIVVGQFASPQAMAAVGSTGSLNNLIVNIFLGLSIGSSVLMARFYGAKNRENIHDLIHTSILLSLTSGCVLIVLGQLLAKPLLTIMGTPDDVINQSILYMRIVFLGMPAMLTYDFGAGILRAVGDTKRPLAYLFIAGIINVCLNLISVIIFGMGVAGVAIATITSQYISALLVLRCMIKTNSVYKLNLKELRIRKSMLLRIIRIGVPAGIQGALFNVSNVLIQSSINSFGSLVMAGNTAAANIEGFVYTSMNAVYQASTNFTSQNVGAHKTKNITPVLLSCMLIVTSVGLILSTIVEVFAYQLLGIYSADADVISYGIERLHVVCLTYFLCGLMDTACGSIRGLGYSIAPISYPVSWVVTFIAHIICFIIFSKKWKRKIEAQDKKIMERA